MWKNSWYFYNCEVGMSNWEWKKNDLEKWFVRNRMWMGIGNKPSKNKLFLCDSLRSISADEK